MRTTCICSIYGVVGWVWHMRVPPLSFLDVAIQQLGMSYPPSRLKCELSGVVRMQIASFTTNSIVQLACCSILVSSQWMGWSSVQACSAMADLSMKAFMQASLCSFRCVSSRRVVSPMYTLPPNHRIHHGGGGGGWVSPFPGNERNKEGEW